MSSNSNRAISLRRLLPRSSFVGCADIPASVVTDHHEKCTPGCLFAVIRGTKFDGRQFIADAIASGAAAILTDQPIAGVLIPQCIVSNVRAAYSRLCLALAGNPQRALKILGVTGTNGKTTVTWMLRSIFEAAGHTVGLAGTIETSTGATVQPSALTTPGPQEFANLLRLMRETGTTHAAVELSSHALDQQRLAGLQVVGAVVTNVTQDHFDYHGNLAGYLSAKEQIADYCSYSTPIIANADDVGCVELMKRWNRRRVVRFGMQPSRARDYDAFAHIVEMGPCETVMRFELLGDAFECVVPFIGSFNAANCLAAATAARIEGVSPENIISGLQNLARVPGRMEPVNAGQPFRVFIDYAHTPDALSRVLHTLRQTTKGRLICVFGAGGERDRSKRPLLGEAASAADIAIVTSDNPRSEDPQQILDEVCAGMPETAHVEPDRAVAINHAIFLAEPDDCVVIAGKGHEKTQRLGSESMPFDDRRVALQAMRKHYRPQSDVGMREAS